MRTADRLAPLLGVIQWRGPTDIVRQVFIKFSLEVWISTELAIRRFELVQRLN